MLVIATVKRFPLVRENAGIHNCIHKTNAFRGIPVCRALSIYGFISQEENKEKVAKIKGKHVIENCYLVSVSSLIICYASEIPSSSWRLENHLTFPIQNASKTFLKLIFVIPVHLSLPPYMLLVPIFEPEIRNCYLGTNHSFLLLAVNLTHRLDITCSYYSFIRFIRRKSLHIGFQVTISS